VIRDRTESIPYHVNLAANGRERRKKMVLRLDAKRLCANHFQSSGLTGLTIPNATRPRDPSGSGSGHYTIGLDR